ncbi:MAG: type 4a pilus biogenesis protein PilO, partial [Gemmatimonadaceae bacterium]
MALGGSLTRREQMLVSVSVIAIMIAGAYAHFLYIPKRAQLAAIQQHVDSLDTKNAQAKDDVANGSIARLQQQAIEYDASLKVMRLLVPTTNEVPALLETVSTAARHVGLDLASVEPMPVLVGEQFDTYRYKVSVKG